MSDTVQDLLEEIGPSLSSALVERLVAQGISPEAARQRVCRACGVVKRLQGLQFPNREKFLFLDGQFGNEAFCTNLARAMKSSRTSYGKALLALDSRDNAIFEGDFPAATGLPVEKCKGQIQSCHVLNRLIEFGLVAQVPTPDGTVICLSPTSDISQRRRAVIAVEDVVLGAMKTWLTKIGWTSTGAVKIRSKPTSPQFGQYRFDLVGPCYLHSMIVFKNGKRINGFIIADILLDRVISINDLEGFLSKWASLSAQHRPTRFQPIFVGDSFHPDALRTLREKGCIVACPGTIFGEDVAKQLRELVSTIANAAAAVSSDPQKVFSLLAKIDKIEGASLNLRGVVLELIVAHLFKLKAFEIEIRQRVQSESGEWAEIDVKALDRREVVCVECKGKSPDGMVDASEIDEWLQTSLPRIKSWLRKEDVRPGNRKFAFYSSTDYTDDAKALIAHIIATHKKQPISFYNGQDIIDELHNQHETSLVNIFREHFSPK
jgi:hypothetical protein